MHSITYAGSSIEVGNQLLWLLSAYHVDGSCFNDMLTSRPKHTHTHTHTHHVQDNELPTFPVDPSYLAPLRDHVRLARQIVSMEQSGRKVSRGNKWALQVAKAMEIEVEEDMYPTLMAMIFMNLSCFCILMSNTFAPVPPGRLSVCLD